MSKTNAESDGSAFTPLLSVGDRVRIVKPSVLVDSDWLRWMPEMDKYDGMETHIISILPIPEYGSAPAYDLDIDSGDLGWLHTFLQPIKHV